MPSSISKLNHLTAFVVFALTASTAAGVVLGPNPLFVSSSMLTPPNQGLNDRRDWLILIAWWATAAVVAVISSRIALTPNTTRSIERGWVVRAIAFSSSLGVAVLMSAHLFLDLDRSYTDNFPRLRLIEVGLAVSLAALLIASRSYLLGRVRYVNRAIMVTLVVVFLPALLQTPGGIRDEGHFFYTANELAAPAVGFFPLGGFISQYTNLLGYPIVPFLRLFSDHAVVVILTWLIGLQVLCLLLPVLAARMVNARRWAVLSLFIPTALVSMSSQAWAEGTAMHSASTYFAVFPLRTVLPAVLFSTVIFLCKRDVLFARSGAIVVGLLTGLTALNNADFGLPAVGAVSLAVLALSPSFRLALNWIVFTTIGVLAVVASYFLCLHLLGRQIYLADYLLFQRVFGEVGFLNEPMAPGGLHVFYATVFIIGLAIGVLGIRRARQSRVREVRVAALLLMITSLWALLTLAYFSGRSFTSTLTGGLSYQLGLVFVAVVLWGIVEAAFIRSLLDGRLTQIPSLLAVGVAISLFIASAAFRAPRPDLTWDRLVQGGSQLSESAHLDAEARVAVTSLKSPEIQVHQMLVLSNVLELEGVGVAELVVNHPAYISLSPIFLRRQCEYLAKLPETRILESTASTSLVDSVECQQLVSLKLSDSRLESQDLRIIQVSEK